MVNLSRTHESLNLANLDSERDEDQLPRPHLSGVKGLPQNGRVAVLFRGQSFRARGARIDHPVLRNCLAVMASFQFEAMKSFESQVLRPLLQRGNNIDVVFTDVACSLHSKLMQFFDNVHVIGEYFFTSPSQGASMRLALNAFKDNGNGSEAIARKYDLVFVVRYDINWKRRIDKWAAANLSIFNFPSRCEPGANWTNGQCVSDIFHIMPGRLFPTFDAEVGRGSCFTSSQGHECFNQMLNATTKQNSSVGFASPWIPQKTIQEKNSWFELY